MEVGAIGVSGVNVHYCVKVSRLKLEYATHRSQPMEADNA